MTSLRLTSGLALAILLSSGCVSNATLRTSFREEIDQCVGKEFMSPETWSCRWSDAIAKREISAAEDEYEIALDFMGKCRWNYVVDRETRRVISWRYASGQEDCYTRIDWLGAW